MMTQIYASSEKMLTVTQVISNILCTYENVPQHLLEQAAERGTLVHNCCFALLKDEFYICHDDTAQEFIESFKLWQKHVSDVLYIEPELVDSKLDIVGHPDLICRFNGKVYLVDLKATSQKQLIPWKLQIAAYVHLCRVNNIQVDIGGCLWLRRGKAPEFLELKNIEKWQKLFFSCVDVYKLKNI